MDSSPPTVRAIAMSVALPLGVAAELASGAGPGFWLPDLFTGLALVVAACVAWPGERRTAGLLALAGAAWFAGTAWSPLLSMHLGVLAHLLLLAPARCRRTALAATVFAYAGSLGLPFWRSDLALAGFALGMLLTLALVARPPALRAGAVLFGGLLFGVAVQTGLPDGPVAESALLTHQAAVCLVAILVGSQSRRPDVAAVTDRVVELGEAGSLRDALASTVGDPSLELGYATANGSYVGERGKAVSVPGPGDDRRRATFVRRDGVPFAVLVHGTGVLDDPDLQAALAAATRLSGAHDELLAVLQAQLLELDASRRRLVLAADEAQARLELRVRDGAEQRLRELERLLVAAEARRPGPVVGRVRDELFVAVDELRSLAQGLRPRELDAGLHAALRALSRRSVLSVAVEGVSERYDLEVETTAWFVCAEAVANAVKHARAGCVRIATSRQDDVLEIVVVDDGVGGADLSRGTGLRGLVDRVEALHGRCAVLSPYGGGTRLTVELPLDRQAIPSG